MDSLDEMVRDFTKTRPRAKSEVRKRITQYVKEQTDENEMNAGLNEAITICLTPAHNQKHPSPEALRIRDEIVLRQIKGFNIGETDDN